MSLSSILKSKNNKELLFLVKNIKPHLKIISPSNVKWGSKPLVHHAAKNSSLVGMTWDYWLRLWLLKYYKGKEGTLIAEKAVNQFPIKFKNLPNCLSLSSYLNSTEESKEIIKSDLEPSSLKIALEVKENFEKSIGRRHEVLLGNLDILSDDIVKDCILLSKLDQQFRAKVKWMDSSEQEIHDVSIEINELATLWLNNQERFGKPPQPIWANPSFGEASDYIGGADADIVIGSNLWDFKTTKHLQFETYDWAQLLGYYILSKWGKTEFNINQAGIHFARFNTLIYVELEDISEIIESFYNKFFHITNSRSKFLCSLFADKKIIDFRFELLKDYFLLDKGLGDLAKKRERTNYIKNHLKSDSALKDLLKYKDKLNNLINLLG